MIEKPDINDSTTNYKEKIDILIVKLYEIIDSYNYLESKMSENISDAKLEFISLNKSIKKIESTVNLLITNAKNRSNNNELFIKSVMEKIDMLKNMVDDGSSTLISIDMASIKKIETDINLYKDVTKQQLDELNEIYSRIKNRI
jgi:hypothetical protein